MKSSQQLAAGRSPQSGMEITVDALHPRASLPLLGVDWLSLDSIAHGVAGRGLAALIF